MAANRAAAQLLPAADNGRPVTEDKKDDDDKKGGIGNSQKPLADELGIEDIYDPMVGAHGKVFCTAGRDAPIAEFTEDFLILHPPQLPLDESDNGEDFTLRTDSRGILLDELGEPKKVPAATFRGCPIYYSGERAADSQKHFAVALAHDGGLHGLFHESGRRFTVQDIYNLRNRSAAGELSIFPELKCAIEE